MSVVDGTLSTVHPRACGGHGRDDEILVSGRGSSPRLRGTRHPAGRRDRVARFIPAPAGDTPTPFRPPMPRPVHPRACGGHLSPIFVGTAEDGSSPRLRGTRPTWILPRQAYRFIPAPAGDTEDRIGGFKRRPVHPRACGGHHHWRLYHSSCNGSSPRLRGTQLFARRHLIGRRFIPAPAGDTSLLDHTFETHPVHPRACGGHLALRFSGNEDCGSSPRLRGTRSQGHRRRARRRFIPAPAGDTLPLASIRKCHAVHPRACGGHCAQSVSLANARGSSPRLRGTRSCNALLSRSRRFIPAPAGDTRAVGEDLLDHGVHPRACGGHTFFVYVGRVPTGSSPRLRGTHQQAQRRFDTTRFIPAPAGDTPIQRSPEARQAVHPRACGGHFGRQASGLPHSGSSPRLRGTLEKSLHGIAGHRFIPAPAGDTSATNATAILHTVHPRACGGHDDARDRAKPANGSSPRLRGTPPAASLVHRVGRFIPAPAGDTRALAAPRGR